MKKLRDLSRLPEDQGYWDRLEARIAGKMGRRAAGQLDWWSPLATRAMGLTGLAAAAGIAAMLIMPPRAQDRRVNPTVLFRLPDDPTMKTFLSSPRPPSLASLLASLPRSNP